VQAERDAGEGRFRQVEVNGRPLIGLVSEGEVSEAQALWGEHSGKCVLGWVFGRSVL